MIYVLCKECQIIVERQILVACPNCKSHRQAKEVICVEKAFIKDLMSKVKYESIDVTLPTLNLTKQTPEMLLRIKNSFK